MERLSESFVNRVADRASTYSIYPGRQLVGAESGLFLFYKQDVLTVGRFDSAWLSVPTLST